MTNIHLHLQNPSILISIRRLGPLLPEKGLTHKSLWSAILKITRDVVEKIAELAQLRIPESDFDVVTKNMSRILDLVEEMQSVDTTGIDPMANPLDATQTLRPDTVTEQDQHDLYQQIAPDTEDGLYLVPRVID
jgi:aspartyl-tRNA(Asn)/glutamyl-tRNA(Gln) amidotransferase subunit C